MDFLLSGVGYRGFERMLEIKLEWSEIEKGSKKVHEKAKRVKITIRQK